MPYIDEPLTKQADGDILILFDLARKEIRQMFLNINMLARYNGKVMSRKITNVNEFYEVLDQLPKLGYMIDCVINERDTYKNNLIKLLDKITVVLDRSLNGFTLTYDDDILSSSGKFEAFLQIFDSVNTILRNQIGPNPLNEEALYNQQVLTSLSPIILQFLHDVADYHVIDEDFAKPLTKDHANVFISTLSEFLKAIETSTFDIKNPLNSIHKLQQQINALEDVNLGLTAELSEAVAQHKFFEREYYKLLEAVKNETVGCEIKNKVIDQERNKNHKLGKKIKHLEATIEAGDKVIKKKDEEIEELRKRVANQEQQCKEVNKYREQINSLEATRQKQMNDINRINKEIITEKNKSAGLQKQIDILNEQLQHARDQLASKDQSESLKKYLEDLTQDFNLFNRSIPDLIKNPDNINNIDFRIKEIKDAFSVINKTYFQNISKKNNENNNNENNNENDDNEKISELEAALNEYKAAMSELEQQNKRLKTSEEKHYRKVIELQLEIDFMKNEQPFYKKMYEDLLNNNLTHYDLNIIEPMTNANDEDLRGQAFIHYLKSLKEHQEQTINNAENTENEDTFLIYDGMTTKLFYDELQIADFISNLSTYWRQNNFAAVYNLYVNHLADIVIEKNLDDDTKNRLYDLDNKLSALNHRYAYLEKFYKGMEPLLISAGWKWNSNKNLFEPNDTSQVNDNQSNEDMALYTKWQEDRNRLIAEYNEKLAESSHNYYELSEQNRKLQE
ncbi:hypothetical protein TRFO_05458 [Tritrichomonas foetus]|uniref:Uncharacterized protein n=1 Tax=Tritrichomonas foetus TaxID=1144522 RepID=A0A1J4K6F9_9EUKA|nr:hypothetical protein TRFO_05458 [Tritrichomonas foetus]|eukprot:OHT06771.1 hypothetical protein TRFO_05458 [Tritrichomonas foetus]